MGKGLLFEKPESIEFEAFGSSQKKVTSDQSIHGSDKCSFKYFVSELVDFEMWF